MVLRRSSVGCKVCRVDPCDRATALQRAKACLLTPNLPTKIVDLGGFDSSVMSLLRGRIPRPIGDFPESLSQAMLVGIMLAGRLGVAFMNSMSPPARGATKTSKQKRRPCRTNGTATCTARKAWYEPNK